MEKGRWEGEEKNFSGAFARVEGLCGKILYKVKNLWRLLTCFLF